MRRGHGRRRPALAPVIQEVYVQGVPGRPVAPLAKASAVSGISKSLVSRFSAAVDERSRRSGIGPGEGDRPCQVMNQLD